MELAQSQTHSLCIIVPCHNEEESIPALLDAVKTVADRDLSPWLSDAPEFVFVDDGSTDGTLDLLRRAHQEDPRCHYVSFSRNFGKEAAIAAGFQRALRTKATEVCLMDADLQDPPSLLKEMYQRLDDPQCDVAAAYRVSREGEPPVRSWFARRFYSLINALSDIEIVDGARDFRLMRRQVAQCVVDMPERMRFSKGLFAWVGFETVWVPYENVEREHGQSNWSFWGLLRYAFEGIVAFSVKPLEIISVLGVAVFLLAVVMLLFIVIRAALFGDPVAGWPSLAALITLFSGLQLLAAGVLGLYLSKVYSEVKDRPIFIVKEEEWAFSAKTLLTPAR